MSWDVVLVKEKFDTNQKDYKPLLLGKRDEIILRLTEIFSNLDYSDKSWGILEGEGFSIEFNTGKSEDVDSIMLHVRGRGEPVKVIHLIMKQMKWEAIDCSTGEFMNINDAETNSWQRFQNYRDKIFKKK